MLDARHAKLADLYYIRTIEEFRRELSDPACVDQDATVYAGLLLCSVSVRSHSRPQEQLLPTFKLKY